MNSTDGMEVSNVLVEDDLDQKIFEVKHKALRNALYHTARTQWFDGSNKLMSFYVIIGASSAASDLLGYYPEATPFLIFSVAVVGAIQLVYDFGGRAMKHATLQRDYYRLLAEVERNTNPNFGDCAHWNAEISTIAGDSPPNMRALDAMADNQTTTALLGGNARLEITPWQHFTRHLFRHNSGEFKQREDWYTGYPDVEGHQPSESG